MLFLKIKMRPTPFFKYTNVFYNTFNNWNAFNLGSLVDCLYHKHLTESEMFFWKIRLRENRCKLWEPLSMVIVGFAIPSFRFSSLVPTLLAIVLQLTPRTPLYFIVVNACKLRSQYRGRVSILTELIRVQSLFFARHKKPSIRRQHRVLPRYEQYPVHTNGCARRRPLLASRPVFLWWQDREREQTSEKQRERERVRLEIGPNEPWARYNVGNRSFYW